MELAKESPRRLAEKVVRLKYSLEEQENDSPTAQYAFGISIDLSQRRDIVNTNNNSKTFNGNELRLTRTYVWRWQERAVAVLKDALEHQRKISGNGEKKFAVELNNRLERQKVEYEATIKRHQNFVDQVRNCFPRHAPRFFFVNPTNIPGS
jgi:hypothetical protein